MFADAPEGCGRRASQEVSSECARCGRTKEENTCVLVLRDLNLLSRSLDERQRERARLARLAMLERDNHVTDNTHMMKVHNLGGDELIGKGEQKKKRKKISLFERTKNRTLDQMMQEAETEMVQAYGASYYDIVSPPPGKNEGIAKKLCSICGYIAPYTCRITGMRFCSRPCLRVHEETRLKGLK
ncbi:hypothetical protein GUITHDRAFT_113638 [Guillardia theta CCMP2712]|uniref:HIT-type domain-containing protein n=1 Tax=Guillardia theta (strain CCMP2712) TaxID=905079 RepID=L1IVL5_GUITC|nr:hypothetical protein GUITHDRAFT_113638 [Guillardia theta CCMP2712]EKX40157.1 hypothetical protein GUITHDRAFT_113638 [Guillardia theta CCMP2712]|eukprot:XP_005827137.1 hypothetical protein GUITHDRAFT_113638 [Guillardia theta CCMP2712]